MAQPPIDKKKIPPKPQRVQTQKKKKKNAPDAPQPKWLFPPDEENPILNPKAKTPEEAQKKQEEREKSLDYMKRRVHAVPDRAAPPSELLTLVGIFLTDFGFNSTSRLFTNERKARMVLSGWEDTVGKKIKKDTPKLEQIYRNWHRDWKAQQLAPDETSSSESDSESSDSDSDVGAPTQLNDADSSGGNSEVTSDASDGSDVEMKEAPKTKGKKVKAVTKRSVSPSSSSTSDSDADDENEKKKMSKAKAVNGSKTKKSLGAPKAISAQPTVSAMIKNLKRKATSSSEASESSSDSSESSEDEPPTKRTKTATKTSTSFNSLSNGKSDSSSSETDESDNSKPSPSKAKSTPTTAKADTSSESSSSDSSDSESSGEEAQPTNGVRLIPKASSDSSATITGDVKNAVMSASESDSSSAATSESDPAPRKTEIVKKEKKPHTGAKPTPLAELSAKGIQGHVSNQYQSYEYADRAYKDLSVTRGKGFTKEKNKKKRGSYRGGTIDTSGGKGFKFED